MRQSRVRIIGGQHGRSLTCCPSSPPLCLWALSEDGRWLKQGRDAPFGHSLAQPRRTHAWQGTLLDATVRECFATNSKEPTGRISALIFELPLLSAHHVFEERLYELPSTFCT